jgi:hypothetical protein
MDCSDYEVYVDLGPDEGPFSQNLAAPLLSKPAEPVRTSASSKPSVAAPKAVITVADDSSDDDFVVKPKPRVRRPRVVDEDSRSVPEPIIMPRTAGHKRQIIGDGDVIVDRSRPAGVEDSLDAADLQVVGSRNIRRHVVADGDSPVGNYHAELVRRRQQAVSPPSEVESEPDSESKASVVSLSSGCDRPFFGYWQWLGYSPRCDCSNSDFVESEGSDEDALAVHRAFAQAGVWIICSDRCVLTSLACT